MPKKITYWKWLEKYRDLMLEGQSFWPFNGMYANQVASISRWLEGKQKGIRCPRCGKNIAITKAQKNSLLCLNCWWWFDLPKKSKRSK